MFKCVACLQCVGDDIENLEYTPKPEFEGCFKVINVKNEVMNSNWNHIFFHMYLSLNLIA